VKIDELMKETLNVKPRRILSGKEGMI